VNGIEVKYRNGKRVLRSLRGISAAMARQILGNPEVQAKLRRLCGIYRWDLDQDRDGYVLQAVHAAGTWIENRGKTPREALRGFLPLRDLLVLQYGFEWDGPGCK
jgi:hypothetical protein